MSKYGIVSISKHDAILAIYQVLVIIVLQSQTHTKSKSQTIVRLLLFVYIQLVIWSTSVCDGRTRAQSTVSSLWFHQCTLDLWSLLGLTTIVAAFLDSSKHDPHT